MRETYFAMFVSEAVTSAILIIFWIVLYRLFRFGEKQINLHDRNDATENFGITLGSISVVLGVIIAPFFVDIFSKAVYNFIIFYYTKAT